MPSAASGLANSSSLSDRISANAVLRSSVGTRAQQPLGLGDGRGAPARTPAHNRRRWPATSSVTWVTRPDRRGPVGRRTARRSASPRDRCRPAPAQDRHRDDRRGDADADLGEGERDAGGTTTRSHDAISPMPPARTAPSTAAIVGQRRVHQPLHHARPSGASRAGRSGRSFRSAPAQNAGPSWRSTIDPGVDDVRVERIARGRSTQLARQRVAVVRGVERDRGDCRRRSRPDELTHRARMRR